MANAQPPSKVQIETPIVSSLGWPYSDTLPGVTPRFRLSGTPKGGTWVVDINDADVGAPANYNVAIDSRVTSVLETFVDVHGIRQLVEDAIATARTVFGAANVSIKKSLFTDADLNEDFVRLDIDVRGTTRAEFRARESAFDTELERLRDASGLERLLIITTRRGGNATP